jgi:hypothetical protein
MKQTFNRHQQRVSSRQKTFGERGARTWFQCRRICPPPLWLLWQHDSTSVPFVKNSNCTTHTNRKSRSRSNFVCQEKGSKIDGPWRLVVPTMDVFQVFRIWPLSIARGLPLKRYVPVHQNIGRRGVNKKKTQTKNTCVSTTTKNDRYSK